MPLGPGSRLDAYELLSPLGAGGMGEVWLATEVRLGRKVALKLLPADLTKDPARVSRFEQEARAASALSHPNVCTIHALGETADGQHYIAMEYVEGETLRRRLTTSHMSVREALDIAIQIASALSSAHAVGIVHRDIKPENVMIRPDGFVKVLDFGLAKLVSASDAMAAQATRTAFKTDIGHVVGTVTYMSPEQARAHEVDARTDVWALGCVLYEMAAGRSPFAERSSSDTLAAILDREPPPLARFEPGAPAELQRIIIKTLRKDRTQRYQTTQDLLLDLQALREDVHARTRSESSFATQGTPSDSGGRGASNPAQTRRAGGQLRWILSTAMVLAVAAGGGVWWLWFARHSAVTRAPTAQPWLTRVTYGPGLQTDPTFSPDARFIAYASDRSGNFDIWVQPATGGDAVRITTSSAQDTEPDWSPDGANIVFRSDRDGGGLFIVPALGGAERRLTTFGAQPRWSLDGSEIIFFVIPPGTFAPQSVYSVASIGGEPKLLLGDFTRQGTWLAAASHPDGRISVLGTHRERGFGFFTVSRDGRRVQTSTVRAGVAGFTPSGPGLYVYRFSWTASGAVLYCEGESNGVRNLWKVSVDPATLEWTSAERLTTGTGQDSSPAISRDGTRVVFTVRSESTRIFAYPFDAAAGRVVGEGKPVTEEQGNAGLLALSRDGRRLAYLMYQVGSRFGELRTITLDDGRAETVVPDHGFAWPGAWSHNGRAFAYEVFEPKEHQTSAYSLVIRTGPDERRLRPWTREFMFIPSDWTPDDSAILGTQQSATNTGPARLVLWPASGPPVTKPLQVLIEDPNVRVWQAQYSPDGRWIAFVAELTDRGRADMLAMPASGAARSSWVRLAPAFETADKPRWSPDGRAVYFLARHSSYPGYNMWRVPFDRVHGVPAGPPSQVTSFTSATFSIYPEMGLAEIGVSSTRLALPMLTVTGSIWMLDNVDK